MKKCLCSILALTLLVLATVATPPWAHAAAGWRVWVATPLTRVQPTDLPGSSTAATLKVARNEFEAVQVIVRAHRYNGPVRGGCGRVGPGRPRDDCQE